MKKLFTEFAKACCALSFLTLISTLQVSAQYCTSASSNSNLEWLTNVTFAGIDNDSEASNYTDFTDISGTVIPGVNYEFSGTIGLTGSYQETLVVYIDWDQSETFEPSERTQIGTSCNTNGCVLTDDIEVPADAVPGETRMRVVMKYFTASTDPCETPATFSFGEVEDYTILVNSGECTPPNFTFTVTNDCEADTYGVSSVINDYGSNSFVTILVTRSDDVTAPNVNIPSFAIPIGSTVPIIDDVPFGVSISLSIEGQNAVCNLTRNYVENICPAENDEACEAISLVCGDALIDQPFIGATQSIDDACFGAGTDDIWYSFTSDGAEKYSVAETSTANTVVGLYSADDCGDLTAIVDCQDFPENFLVEEAGNYYFRVRSSSGNDDFAAVSLTCIPFDCPDITADFGSSCDDNDASTFNDIIQDDCSCAGIIPVPGQICEVPLDITALPYTTTGNTENYFDDYESVDVPPAAPNAVGNGSLSNFYLGGDDVVYTYTPTSTQSLNITVSNHGSWSGVYVFTGCPFNETVGYFTSSSSTIDLTVNGLIVQPGVTYYIVISTWPTPQSTSYTLDVEAVPFDCPNLLQNFGAACDDGDDNTSLDTINEDCECAGIPNATNDEACTAIALACNDTLVDQTFLGATVSIEDNCTNPTNGDVWYSFTAMEGMGYIINEPSFNSTVASLYIGNECGELSEVQSCVNFFNTFSVTEPGDYYFRIRAYSTQVNHSVGLICAPVPSNDEACTATLLECGDNLSGQSFVGATQSFDDACGGVGTSDVWYTFVTDGTQAVTVAETETDVIVDLWTGDDCGNLTDISGCVDFGENFTVTDAGIYYFRIRPWGSASTYGVSLTCVDFATNDEACTATTLECGDNLADLTFAGATQSVVDECFGSGTADVWFTFTSDGSQALTIAETSFNNVVVDLWAGDDCGNLTAVAACSDFPENFAVNDAGTYFFRIRPQGTQTSYGVSLTCADFATNDEACTATTLVCGDTLSGQSFAGATQSFDDVCSGSGTADVWFTFEADGTQNYFIEETETDVVVDLWIGDDCGNLTDISGCVDFGENFTVTEAGTYYFRIRPWSSATTFGVALTCTPFDCPGLGNVGDSCDDDDAGTVNDVLLDDCTCAGDPVAANDEACNATVLECGDALTGLSFTGSTQSFDDECNGSGTGDLWFTFVSDGSQSYVISETTFNNVVVDLWSDDCGDLTVVQSCSDFPENFQVNEAGTYYFRVRPFSTATSFAVTLTCTEFDCPDISNNIGNACDDGDDTTTNDLVTEDCECVGDPIPDNDDCADAIEVSCGDFVLGTTVGASENVGCNGNSRQTVWYSFTPENSGDVILSTCNDDTNFDTDLNVYSGSCDDLTCFTGFEGNGYVDGVFSCPSQSYAAVGTLEAVAGQTYYIAVTGFYTAGGFSEWQGDFGLSIECADPSAIFNGSVTWNSNCDDRESTVTFYEPNTSTVAATYTTTVNSAGEFTIADVLIGTYDVIVDVPGFLNKGLADVVTVSGDNSEDFGAIVGGDGNNSNSINVADFSGLNAAFGSVDGDANYNLLSDFNCSGTINIADFSGLNAAFGQGGANAPLP